MRYVVLILIWPHLTASLPVSEQTAHWRRLLPIIARANQIDPQLLKAIVWHESRFNTRAQSSTHDYGLAQLNRRTIASYQLTPVDARDPVISLTIAAAELRILKRRFGTEKNWWCRYNVGTAAYETVTAKCQRYVLRVYADAQTVPY